MPRMAQFILTLIVGLALLTWAATGVVQTTAREWFERDVSSRTELVLTGTAQSLANAWYGETPDLRMLLMNIARDERVIGVAACDVDLKLRSSTPSFPEEFRCSAVGSRVRAATPSGDAETSRLRPWSTYATLPTGRVYVSAMPVTSETQDEDLGFVTLVHDLSYIERREAQARTFLLLASGFLAVLAFGVPMFVARRARYGWTLELRSLLRGGKQKREFQPILNDLRELVDRMTSDQEDASGQWTARRLKQTLNRHLHGEQIVILANREPYIHERRADGHIEVLHPASGLVTALEPVMRACSGVWVAHGSGNADRETVDRNDHISVPPGEGSYHIRRVWLSEEELQGYYYGFSNEGLWPLCHVAHTRPVFRAEDWRRYQVVNEKFADAVCSEAHSKDPIVLVQDYHFALAPAMIRKRLPCGNRDCLLAYPLAER
jgi:trehalose 6-phosphate synthase